MITNYTIRPISERSRVEVGVCRPFLGRKSLLSLLGHLEVLANVFVIARFMLKTKTRKGLPENHVRSGQTLYTTCCLGGKSHERGSYISRTRRCKRSKGPGNLNMSAAMPAKDDAARSPAPYVSSSP